MKKNWIIWWISLAAGICCLLINYSFFRFPSMIELEFSPSGDTMRTCIMEAAPLSAEKAYHLLYMNTLVDYCFIVSYTVLTYLSLKLLLSLFEVSANKWIFILSIITGLLDVFENNFLMQAAIRQREEFSWLYAEIVRVKWGVALIPIFVIPVILIYGIIVLLRDRKNDRNIS